MSIPLTPLGALWSGVLHAWAFVLGPWSGLITGTVLGLFAAGWSEAGIPVAAAPTLGAMLIPMAMFGTTFGQMLAFITAIAILGFWGSETWRPEAWIVLCLTGGIQTFALFAGEADLSQFIRITLACAVLAGVHAAATVYPIWRYGDNRKRRRKRKRRPGGRRLKYGVWPERQQDA